MFFSSSRLTVNVIIILFQAVDGQPIILHPLNLKCLLHHYGSYDLLPERSDILSKRMHFVLMKRLLNIRHPFLFYKF